MDKLFYVEFEREEPSGPTVSVHTCPDDSFRPDSTKNNFSKPMGSIEMAAPICKKKF